MEQEKIFADINQEWEALSDEHKKVESEFEEVLNKFLKGDDVHPSYLVTGVFGQGKTTFLYHLLRKSMDKGILPIFVIARDLFENIEAKDYGEVKREIDKIVEQWKADIQNGDFSQYRKSFIASLSQKSQSELIKFYQENLDKISKSDKLILLIDELEDAYKNIKEKAGLDPLRTWLEDKSYLKILALTPSGIYDLGGADESRLIKWDIPPVTVEHLRDKMDLPAGKANALWWLSRGIPRHIIKNLNKIKNLSEEDGDYKIVQTLESLDHIGKEPGRVNAVEIGVDHSKIKYLINFVPQEVEKYKYRGFLITKELEEGVLSNAFQKMFNLRQEKERGLALVMAHYFKFLAMTLSDEDYNMYLPENEINEFMQLVLDVLLEHDPIDSLIKDLSPEKRKEEKPKLYKKLIDDIPQKLKSDNTLLLSTLLSTRIKGILHREDINKKLPFTIREIRNMFPLPMANPIIKSNPDDTFKEIEGKGLPVCKNDSFMFFASYRDFENYLVTDEFKSIVLPEGKHFVILLPEEGFNRFEQATKIPTLKNELFLKWLLDQGKLKVVKSPPSIKMFLLSLYGYEGSSPPYNIDSIAENIKTSDDFQLKKKFELYYTALNDLIKDNNPNPKLFFTEKPEPKGVGDVWGDKQLKEENIAIAGLSLSFYNLTPRDKINLISLRELFRSKRGELADIKVGKGLPTLADDLLPRKDSQDRVVDSSYVESLKNFWSNDEEEGLKRLSRLLDLLDFKKLHDNVNYHRILEAFWRATRDEFNIDGIDKSKRRLQEVIKKLEFIRNVELDLSKDLKLHLIFEEDEDIVKSLEGLKKLVNLSFEKKLPKYIHKLYLDRALTIIEYHVNKLHNKIQEIERKADDLKKETDKIIQYVLDRNKVLDFISDELSLENIKQELKNLKTINNDLNISEAKGEVKDRLEIMEKIFIMFTELEEKIKTLEKELSEHNLLEVK